MHHHLYGKLHHPADDELNVELDRFPVAETEISIFDAMGRVMTNFIAEGYQHTIDTSTWSSGVYLLCVHGTDIRKKVILR